MSEDKRKIVKCYVINDKTPPERTVRYIPLDEFNLWKNLMEQKHGFQIEGRRVSTWIGREEFEKRESIYQRLTHERVKRLDLSVYADQHDHVVQITRFFPEEDFERLKTIFLRHFEDKKTVNEPEETPGYCIYK